MEKKNRKQLRLSKKKLLRLKKRRHISSDQLFKKKADQQLMLMDWSIRQAFPDPVKRQKYIQDLIDGLETEKTYELGQFKGSEDVSALKQIE